MENLSHNINSFELLDSLIIESIQAIRSKHKKRPDELTIFNHIIRKPLKYISYFHKRFKTFQHYTKTHYQNLIEELQQLKQTHLITTQKRMTI